MTSKDNYSVPISVSQLNINCFKCSENKKIYTSVYKMVDIKNDLIDAGVTKMNVYIDKSLERCYDESEKNDYLMFVCESYEEMKKIIAGDKGRIAIMENLKRLGGDIAFTDHINSTIDNKIIERQLLEDEFKERERKLKKELKVEYKAGLKKLKEEYNAEGRAEEKNKMIVSLSSEGVSLDTISKGANLDIDVVQDIIKKSN